MPSLISRIQTLKQEKSALNTAYGEMEQKMSMARVRFAQLTGAIDELEKLKKLLNGSE